MRPVFSVVIPTHNRREALRGCLRALTLQQFPQDSFEVIVVDDGGSQPVEDVMQGFHGQLNWRLQRQERSGPATARNLGALSARGEYLAFTDDDCAPSPEWLVKLQESLAMHPGSLIGGRVVNALAGSLCSSASQLLIDYLYASHTENGAPRFFASNNIALSRRAFADVGGFDESFPLAAAEDRDFCARWTQAGGSMVYAPSALVRHAHSLTIPEFARQHFRYGRGAYQFRRRIVRRGGQGPQMEPLSFYLGLLSYPFTAKSGVGAGSLRISLLFLLSQAANVAGFVREALAISPTALGRGHQ